MTTTETVICMIPLRAAAAPRNAYVPGVMHGTSGSQAEKNRACGKVSCRACTRIPIILPNEAPIAIDGTKMPAGTLQPYEMMTRKVLRIVANARDSAIVQRFSDLAKISNSLVVCFLDILAKSVIVMASFTLEKEDFHTLGHVDS